MKAVILFIFSAASIHANGIQAHQQETDHLISPEHGSSVHLISTDREFSYSLQVHSLPDNYVQQNVPATTCGGHGICNFGENNIYLYLAEHLKGDYYWRDSLNEDAFIAGWDSDSGDYYYIGQAVANWGSTYGAIPVKVLRSETQVIVPLVDGPVRIVHPLKILSVTNQTEFQWLKTTMESFNEDIYNNGWFPLLGGWEMSNANLFIGDELFIGRFDSNIGKVTTHDHVIYLMTYAANISYNSEPVAEYEVLVYKI